MILCITSIMPAFAASTRRCYTINTGNTRVYSNTGLTNGYGWIYDSDEITVLNVTSCYTKVTYPVSRGTKTGYIYTSAILTATGGSSITSKAKVNTYRRPGGAKYGSVYAGDKVLVLGSRNGYTQIKYPVSGGYKYAWVTGSDLNAMKGTNNAPSQPVAGRGVTGRLDQILKGQLTYNSSTVMKQGSRFTGYRSNEQCKGYAKNVFYLCFKITPGSTQSKPNNYKLNSTSGMKLVASSGSLTAASAKNLFAGARPGDFVQIRRRHTGSHSAIVYSVTSSGVTFVEANLDGRNTVSKNTYTWADLNSRNAGMSVYTATSYSLK